MTRTYIQKVFANALKCRREMSSQELRDKCLQLSRELANLLVVRLGAEDIKQSPIGDDLMSSNSIFTIKNKELLVGPAGLEPATRRL